MEDFVVRKLKRMRRIEPDSSWLSSQKDFILSEISQSQKEQKERKPSLVLPLFNFNILKILKPNFAVALVVIILVSSLATVGAISFAQNSLPGDFLYPVKTAFEKTQFTFTPSQEGKTKLSIKLATQRMDEFTQLVDKPEKKEDVEKTVKKFTEQLVSVQENIDKLKEKNADKAAEVAKIVKAQTPIYEETLIEGGEQLAYIIPEDREDLKKGIDEALKEVNKAEEMSEELIPKEELIEEPAQSPEGIEAGPPLFEDLGGDEGIESASLDFENLNEEKPQEEEE
jgi:hypothetical protein